MYLVAYILRSVASAAAVSTAGQAATVGRVCLYRRANNVRTEPHARHAATTTRRFSGSASARVATRQRLRRRTGQQVTSVERAHRGRPHI